MKILVTGSLGTLGTPLVAELRMRGHAVFGVDVRHSNEVDFLRADVAEYRQLDRALRHVRPDMVYHLAAEFGRHNGDEYYETLWRTNAVGTRNVLEVQRELGFDLVFASSSEAYGELGDVLLREDILDERPVMQPNDYAISKWVNETQCVNAAKRHGSRIMRLRFFNVYGPGELYSPYRSVVCQFCYRALRGEPYTVYRGYTRSYIYIDDFIPTLANASERFTPSAVINIAGHEQRTVEELSGIVQRYLGLGGALVASRDIDPANVVTKRADITRARALLGHNPRVTLEQGVPATIDWMRDVYHV